MKTLHQILQAARQERKLSVSALHQQTTVPVQLIQALEAGQYQELPPPALVQGALQLLAEELELDPEALFALYRRDGQIESESKVSAPTRRNQGWRTIIRYHLFSPRGLSWTLAGGIFLLAASGLTWQWWQLSQPPELTISSPQNNTVVNNPVRIQGSTQVENTVTINTEVLSIDQDGKFSTTQTLQPGERTLVIEATDQRGRTQQSVIFIKVEK